MKHFNFLFLTLALSIGLMTGCGGGASIVGLWQLHSVSGEELTESEKTATIEFKKDGDMVQTRGDRSKEGKWELKDEDGKKMLITTFDGREEKVEVQTLDATTLSFTDRDELVTLKRK